MRGHLRRPTANLQLLALPHHVQRVPLRDHAHVRNLVVLSRAFQVGLNRVVVQVGVPHPHLAARPLGDVGHLDHHALAVHVAHLVPVSRADPGQRRLAFDAFGLLILRQLDLVEIKLPRQRRDDANSRLAHQLADLRGDDRRRVIASACARYTPRLR